MVSYENVMSLIYLTKVLLNDYDKLYYGLSCLNTLSQPVELG